MYTITVFGTPAPQGSKRHVGKGVLVESSTRLRPWREAVKQAALDVREQTLQGPLSVEIAFTFNKPKSAPKTKVTYPVTRSSGDLDKLCRAVLDALTDAGIMRDDSQVIELIAAKGYAGEDGELDIPGAVIEVRELNGPDIPGVLTVREVTIQ
ncbi:RusA family crossover junction endodeoxyribonuclease [Nonomuraea phyllanthi]|uniref:RusA family crossover junction endodeoxyribonuclease n=1 Tax=Nonomuraea phyllanthi TaxID=2219224 RepID=A0A5C4WTH7_9ACTN|nr:RusA family crossover junction endodeoxyribonuclease [Nonomuraea phyllanthi]KAB8196227.1 RusA family crossover junction endodeoxyribonuclease [Nonomuraea phyllanthi]